jgi:GH18 family chitinase
LKKHLIIFLLSIIIFSCSKDEIIEDENNNPNSTNAMVVGYFPSWRFDLNNQINYCKITHLNLAFANPDSNGNLVMPDISSVVNRAKSENPNIKISISIGGGILTTEQANNWSNLIDNPQNIPTIVSKIVEYVLNNNLDGVDVDLEWQYVTSGYSNFVINLNTELDKHSKIITAALPGTTKYSNITANALQVFDFIHLMAYDFKGPWKPTDAGQHSSYSHAEQSINFWENSIGVSGKKLTLGVPFYGYDFTNSSNVSAFTFSSMVSSNTSYADIDNVGSKFYNGRPTIRSKVKLASNKVNGIMIWELGQDSFTEYSLLKTIHKEYSNLGITTTNLCND